MPTDRTLLAIPVYNEAEHLPTVLSQARRYLDTILVIDDGSTDETPQLIAEDSSLAVIRHARNLGYGRSLSDAFAYALQEQYDWLITMDCDWQHEPSRIPDFIAAARTDEWDIISGSRYLDLNEDQSAAPADRRSINQQITACINDQLGLELTDAFCGFKAYRVQRLRDLHITVDGYAMPLQLWVQAWRANLRITELPVRLIYNDPNRHFGGDLDDPKRRLAHYLAVLDAELGADMGAPRTRAAQWSSTELTVAEPSVSCCGTGSHCHPPGPPTCSPPALE